MDQIRGGICPFLQEKCRQFDAGKIRSDITEQEKAIARLEKDRERSAAAQRAASQICEQMLEARRDEFDRQRVARLRLEHDLEHHRKNLAAIEAEIALLALKIERENKEAKKAESQVRAAAGEISALEERLKSFAEVDRDIAKEQKIKQDSSDGYKQHLGMKLRAEALEQDRNAVKQAAEAETQARNLVQKRGILFERATGEFDPARVATARAQAAAAEAKMAVDARSLKQAEQDLKHEQERLGQ